MDITIKYFGMLAESTGTSEEQIPFSGGTVAELMESLYSKYPVLRSMEFKVAVDQKISTEEDLISNQEIALLPPFSGG